MQLIELLRVLSLLAAVLLVLYSVMDFFSLAHQVKVRRERNMRQATHLVFVMLGACLTASSKIGSVVWGYNPWIELLDLLGMAALAMALYVHFKKTAKLYQ